VGEHGFDDVSGSPYTIFRRALECSSLTGVRAAVGNLPGPPPLDDALLICLLPLDQEPDRHERAAVRWVGRLGLEHRGVSLRHAELGAAYLTAWPDPARRDRASEALGELGARSGYRDWALASPALAAAERPRSGPPMVVPCVLPAETVVPSHRDTARSERGLAAQATPASPKCIGCVPSRPASRVRSPCQRRACYRPLWSSSRCPGPGVLSVTKRAWARGAAAGRRCASSGRRPSATRSANGGC
jgi:hypothetical protein